jgi:hypothetical protein
MVDQCIHCAVKDSPDDCDNTNCSIHETTYAKRLRLQIKQLKKRILDDNNKRLQSNEIEKELEQIKMNENIIADLRNSAKYLARCNAPLLPEGRDTEEVKVMLRAADKIEQLTKELHEALIALKLLDEAGHIPQLDSMPKTFTKIGKATRLSRIVLEKHYKGCITNET